MTFVKTALFHKAGEGSGGGGGGSDPHNLGFYADLTALQTAHPTGSDGDFAILGSTDTVWVWDSGTSAWKDTDTKGQVTSVNGQTGAVTVDTLPSASGHNNQLLWVNYGTPSWSNRTYVSEDKTMFGRQEGTAQNGSGFAVGLYYKLNPGDGNSGVAIGGTSPEVLAPFGIAVGSCQRANAYGAIQIGAGDNNGVGISVNSDPGTMNVALKKSSNDSSINVKLLDSDGTVPSDRLVHAINKYSTMPTAASTNEGWIVQFTGTTDSTYTHGHLYECVSDGADPATYSWAEVSMGGGSGLPDQTGQSGKFLTTDGTNASWSDKPLVNKADLSDANNYSSIVVELDPMNTHASQQGVVITGGALNPLAKKYKGVLIGSGNVGYPAATSNTGVIIGYDASDYTLQFDGGGWAPVAIGSGASCRKTSVAIGWKANGAGAGTIALGANAVCNVTSGGAIQMNMDYQNQVINTDSGTFKVNNSNGNFEIMSADGTIPAARHAALPSADGTYTLQLVIADGVPTLSWVAV